MKIDNNTRIAFLGGDMRAAAAATRLADTYKNIVAWGMPERKDAYGVCYCGSMTEAIKEAFAIILPLPASLDGASLNKKLGEEEEKTALSSILKYAEPNAVIIGGKMPQSFKELAREKGMTTFDYFDSESFQIKNAYTTAEAALNIAMNNLSKNIRGASFAVSGYGRIAKQLVRLLRALGGKVTVAARKEGDIALARLEGCDTLRINREPLSRLCSGYDVIFNTVPQMIFDESFLRRADPRTVFIELASAPGGLDVSIAKKLKTNVLWAASLPGKYAPESAGELIADCILDILEGEVNK